MRRKFTRSIAMLCLAAACGRVTFAQALNQGGLTVLIGVPGSCTPESAAAIKGLLNETIRTVPAGTRLVIFDTTRRQQLADAAVSDMTFEGRKRLINPKLAPVWRHIEKSQAVRAGGAADELDVPGFVPTLASFMSNASGQVRLVLIGSPYHQLGEAGGSFKHGEVPSIDHVLAKSGQSEFGTADIATAFEGVRVDWLLVSDPSNTRERSHVSAFWASYFSHLGGTLTTFIESDKGVADRVSKNAADAVRSEEPKPTGRLQILTIEALEKPERPPVAAPAPATQAPPPKPFEVVADVEQVILVPVTLVIALDGSASNSASLRAGATLAPQIGKLGADLAPAFSLGILVYRGHDFMNPFGPVTIKPPVGGQPNEGMTALNDFINTPTIKVYRLKGSTGEFGGKPTGETATITPFQPTNGYVDVEQAVGTAIDIAKASPHARKVLVLAGDCGTSESDGAFGVTDADRQSEARVIERVRAFVQAYPDARIITIFTGAQPGQGEQHPDRDDAIRFLQAVSALAGDHGIFKPSLQGMDDSVKQAVLNP